MTSVSVLIARCIAGAVSARIGGSDVRQAVVRMDIGGAAGLALTSPSDIYSAKP